MNINKNTELYPFSHILDSFFNTRGKNIEGFNAISSLGSKHYQEKNYYEDKNQLKLELPLPGYSNDELELKFDNGLLSLEAKVDSELNEKALVLRKEFFQIRISSP
jgi:HSP20 family molecular chaperone IbpA